MRRLKVGVIGCGLVAQVMHLHYLRELAERFEIAALCDISAAAREGCARDYGVARRFDDWRALLEADIDAVLVLTSGSHAPIAIAAAAAGKHLLVEKPLCFSLEEGRAMIAAAERAGVVLMVAYNKRYDPAYLRLQDAAGSLRDLRLVRITTLESPFQPYVMHYPCTRAAAWPPISRPPWRRTTMRPSPPRSARPMRCRAAPIIWYCSTAWCGDPVSALWRHVQRVMHVHCKDVRRLVLERARADDMSSLGAVLDGIFIVAGDGCIDLLRLLREADCTRWLAVEAEQDQRKAHPLTYARLGFNSLRALATAAGLTVATA